METKQNHQPNGWFTFRLSGWTIPSLVLPLGSLLQKKCWITSITIQTCEWHVLLSVVNKSIVSYCLLVTYNSFLTFTFPVTRCMVSSLSFLWCFKSKRLEESSGMFLYTTAFSSTTTQAVASCSLLAALSIQVRCLLTVVGFLSSTHTIKKNVHMHHFIIYLGFFWWSSE